MDDLVIIGVPSVLARRLETLAGSAVRLRYVFMGLGKEGRPVLLPHPRNAVYALRGWLDECTSLERVRIVALPFAPMPDDLLTELNELAELGVEVLRPAERENGWPEFQTSLDTPFLDEIYAQLGRLIDPSFAPSTRDAVGLSKPSDVFKSRADSCAQLILTDGSLDDIDLIARHRHTFMDKAAQALAELATRGGRVGPIERFFDERGLIYATTGGIVATLDVRHNGRTALEYSGQVHLKQGDKTTKFAAVRVYYHCFELSGRVYVAVLYAGPHPDASVSRVLEL